MRPKPTHPNNTTTTNTHTHSNPYTKLPEYKAVPTYKYSFQINKQEIKKLILQVYHQKYSQHKYLNTDDLDSILKILQEHNVLREEYINQKKYITELITIINQIEDSKP